jgi:histidyl-tRNA synthetase
MSLTKPRTMPGVMELLPLDQIAFQEMLDTIRANYERFGFLPVETPAIELTDVLLTKTGGETERQVYFVQSTGSLKQGGEPELALRFDLTVPLARYVAEHEHELWFPFRRYQMQRVYRGESAQRGRFREFYQTDIDVIGKDTLSLGFDAEIVAVISAIFSQLQVGPFCIQLNNRRLLRGFFASVGIADGEQQTLILREVDKLDKRGPKAVRETLIHPTFDPRGPAFALHESVVDVILAFVQFRSASHAQALAKLDSLGAANADLEQGVSELREVLEMVNSLGVPQSHYAVNFSIARGLDYYTGTVYETTLTAHPEIGSVCSGGRYENLASNYTKSKLPGVGISIGATRLFYQLREANLIARARSSVKVLVSQMDANLMPVYCDVAAQLRAAGINTELQLDATKMAKQMKYADRAGIRFVLIIGSDEHSKRTVVIKDMIKQEQYEVAQAELIATLRVELEQAAALGAGGVA